MDVTSPVLLERGGWVQLRSWLQRVWVLAELLSHPTGQPGEESYLPSERRQTEVERLSKYTPAEHVSQICN